MSDFVEQSRFKIDYRIDLSGEPLLEDLDSYDLNTQELVQYTNTLGSILHIAVTAGNVPESRLNSIYNGKGRLRSNPDTSNTFFSNGVFMNDFEGSIKVEAYHILDSEDKKALRESVVELLEETEEEIRDKFPYPTELEYRWNKSSGNLDIGIEELET